MLSKRYVLIVWLAAALVGAQAWGQANSNRVEIINAVKAPTVASLSLSATFPRKPADGDAVQLLGYYAPGDGGGQTLIYRATGRSGITVDSGFYFTGFGADDYFEAMDKAVASLPQWGALAADSTDDSTRIQAALNSSAKAIYAPAGTWNVSTQLTVPDGKRLYGDGYQSIFKGSSVTGAVIMCNDTDDHVIVENLRIAGSADVALKVDNCQRSRFTNIILTGFTGTDGFWFEKTWGSTLDQLSTNGASISRACFVLGTEFNANALSNIYTSNAGCTYNVFVGASPADGSSSAPSGHGNAINMLTLQGGRYGLYIPSGSNVGTGLAVNGIYSENCVQPVYVGHAPAPPVRGLTINGGTIGGATSSHPNYAERDALIYLGYCEGVSISGIDFTGTGSISGPPTNYMIAYRRATKISINSCYSPNLGPGVTHTALIKRVADSHVSSQITSTTIGGISSAGGQFLIKEAASNTHEHYIMAVDSTGSWTATPWTAGYAVTPPVETDPVQWGVTTAYTVGQTVYVGTAAVGSNVYICTTAGTSADSGGPTGTGADIEDGTVVWDWCGVLK